MTHPSKLAFPGNDGIPMLAAPLVSPVISYMEGHIVNKLHDKDWKESTHRSNMEDSILKTDTVLQDQDTITDSCQSCITTKEPKIIQFLSLEH